MTFLYRALFYPVFALVMRLVAAGIPKVRRTLIGRRRWRVYLAGLRNKEDELRVHFHAASVGEFEQAKPLIDELRRREPSVIITASFFSSSGFDQQRDYPPLYAACYLPDDRPHEMREFFDRIDTDLVVIIRYDLWLEFLLEARRRGIPAVLVCGVLRSDSSRFNPVVRGFFAKLYGLLSLAHVVGEEDRDALARLAGGLAIEVSGDTRYDRVIARARHAADLSIFTPELIAGRIVIVAGSTWEPDEEILAGLSSRSDILLVLVPHEPSPEHVAALAGRFAGAVLLSTLEYEEREEAPRVVIVDRTGLLSALYRIGAIAYVGGGFGEGVHSVLEPAAYGMPVICGPRTERSRDAEEMRERKILTVVSNEEELRRAIVELADDAELRATRGSAAASFVARRAGATERILESLVRNGLLAGRRKSAR